jgi:hypothetical protein
MRLILFSSRRYDIDTFPEANAAHGFERQAGTPRNVVQAAG